MDTIYNHRALNYNFTGQTNFPHDVRQVEFTPVGTFNQTLNSNDVVRFNISSDDFLNPWSTFLELTIDLSSSTGLVDDTNIKNKILQVDSSAASFIDSMIVSLRDKEIERKNHYDILAAFLKDVKYDTNQRSQRDFEGNGGTQTDSFQSNTYQAAAMPLVNDATRKVLRGVLPQLDLNTYTDTNSRVQQNSNSDYVTRNFSQQYTNTSFTPFGSEAQTTYNAGSDTNEIDNNFSDNTRVTNSLRSNPSTNGVYQLYNPIFACNGFEPWFSKTVYTRYLKNGFLKADTPQTQTFQIPLMSSYFGSLLPPEQWKLIPMKYFDKLQFEFTFCPHALFSSWMSTDQSNRNYVVKKFSMRCEMVKILDPVLLQQVENEYQQNGIRIASHDFFYGPNFNINNGAIPTNLYVNLGFQSLRNFFFMFTPNDHTINSAMRKHYRLSMAITSAQLMMGTDYYPQQPITGNGGTNFGTVNNNEFVKYFLKCFNRHIDGGGGVINQHNFAINCRELDPNSADTNFTGNTQLGFVLENRVIGKGVYGIPLDPMNYEGKMWSGKDTTKNTPFLLNLTYDNSKVFTRAVTMHTFLHHDCLLVVSPSDIVTYGRQ